MKGNVNQFLQDKKKLRSEVSTSAIKYNTVHRLNISICFRVIDRLVMNCEIIWDFSQYLIAKSPILFTLTFV